MVMDHQPRQVVQDVEIRIPGQDEKPFAPRFAAAQPEISDEKPVNKKDTEALPAPAALPASKLTELNREKPRETVEEKSPPKTLEKLPAKVEQPQKMLQKPLAKDAEAQRVEAILAGAGTPPVKSGEYLVLIGAFSNESNVRNLKKKLGEQGIKTFSEPLDTPQGKKTRVRAGPFASREAAEKALRKMQSIGVSGVVSAK
ncbi:MAG: SPOR domain-containing protein [Rhodocyclaceae bacterium]|nr:SPOR domain-containing protein [Rhodocyclaceae bacterium]